MIPALLAGLLGAAPVQAALMPSRQARKTFAAAITQFQRGDFENSIQKFNSALSMHPGWKTATAYRGLCRWVMGDRVGAAEDAAVGIRLRPNSAESFAARGMAALIRKDYDTAEEDFRRSISEDGDSPEPHYGLASIHGARGELPEARASLDKAIRLKSDFAVAYLLRGSVLDRLKDFKAAVRDYDKALEIAPMFHLARYYRARSKRELRQYREALEDFDEFLDAMPEHEEALYLRSNVRYMMSDFGGAAADLDRVLAINPKRGLAYSNRGQARMQLGDRKGALADLRKALDLEPGRKEKIQAAIDRLMAAKAEEEDRPRSRKAKAAAKEEAEPFQEEVVVEPVEGSSSEPDDTVPRGARRRPAAEPVEGEATKAEDLAPADEDAEAPKPKARPAPHMSDDEEEVEPPKPKPKAKPKAEDDGEDIPSPAVENSGQDEAVFIH